MMTVHGNDPQPQPAALSELNPPDWARLRNDQISQFAESLATVLGFEIFPQPLAGFLSNYVYTANAVLQDRVRGGGNEMRR